jgi:serine phosphatase RsbU (regulator of sigma subunit)
MTALTPQPTPPPRRRGSTLLVVWAIALAEVLAYLELEPVLRRAHFATGLFGFTTFFAALVCIAITLYWIATSIRWLLRKLFWRVGRRLLLSYVLIGLLPFFLMTILLIACGYMVAGVMSQAALRGERQATLGQMESAALEYGLTGKKPADALPSLELYDTANGSATPLPDWLKQTTFSGMVWRNGAPLLLCSRQFRVPAAAGKPEGVRTIVLAQPLDKSWARQLEEKGGMIVSYDLADKKGKRKNTARVQVGGGEPQNLELSSESALEEVLHRGVGFNRVIWGDAAELTGWENGATDKRHSLFTFISNPISNLFQFYFGPSSSRYVDVLFRVIIAITCMLLIIYMMAAMFAAVLIFSISRAVNRIEKGTKAVERGDFTYRINMKPRNQLGEMALSFDRMTESISSLLVTVAEKERLQSEIEIAASIQRNLLPKEGPRFRGVSFSAHFEPTASIGGDYYDVFNLDKSRLAVAIGDVSGHGLSTGLVMAMVKAAITTLVEEGADETSLFRRLNELVFRSTERRAFMTLAFTIFDLGTGMIRHTNAGHLYPYLLREGSLPIALESPSLPLGVRSDISTHTVEMKLEEGDAIVYLSDGIVEAQDENGDPFGFDQLESLLGNSTDRSPDAIRDAILRAIAIHCGSKPADDDRTVMVLRFDQFRMLKVAAPEGEVEAAAV